MARAEPHSGANRAYVSVTMRSQVPAASTAQETVEDSQVQSTNKRWTFPVFEQRQVLNEVVDMPFALQHMVRAVQMTHDAPQVQFVDEVFASQSWQGRCP